MNQATSSGRDAAGDQVQRALSAAIDRHGPALLRDPDRLKAMLLVAAPEATRVIGAIVTAVANQVPQSMLAAHSDDHLASILPGLVDRLMAVAPLDHGQATWIVRAWAQALALSTRGLDAHATAAVVTPDTPDRRASIAEVLRPKSSPPPVTVEPAPPSAETARPTVTIAPVVEAASPAPAQFVVPTPSTAAAPVLPRPDVTAVPEAPAPQTWPSARPPAPPPAPPSAPPSSRSGGDAPAIAAAKPRSRWPRAVIAAGVVIVVLGFGGWRWMSLRQPVVATATEEPTRPSDRATREPPATTARPSSAVASEPSDQAAPATSTTVTSSSPSTPSDIATSAASPAPPPVIDEDRTSPPPAVAPTSKSPSPPTTRSQASSAHAATVLSTPRPASVAASASAPASTIGKPPPTTACARTTCGSVVSVRTLRDDGPGSQGAPTCGYEMTIRMDDRSIHTLTQPVPLRTGSRVRMVGNAFVPSED